MLKKFMNFNFYLFIPMFILMILVALYINFTQLNKQINIQNGCSQYQAPFIHDTDDDSRKLSFCAHWNKDKMMLVSDSLDKNRKKYIIFDYIGFPSDENISIYLRDRFNNRVKLENLKDRSENWVTHTFEIPASLKERMSLVAEDNSQSKYGWIGIGNIHMTNDTEEVMLLVYIKTIIFIMLFSFIISTIFGYFLNVRNPLESFVYMALILGFFSYISFYVYYLSIWSGYVVSILFFLFVIYTIFKIDKKKYKLVLIIWIYLISMSMIIFFIAYTNFPHQSHFAVLSALKWHHLPVDNWIPKIFADAILRDNVTAPLFGDWLSSDRPPIQTGLFLLVGSFNPTDLVYLVVSVGAQLLVVLFMTLILSEYVEGRRVVFFSVIILFFSGFIFQNGLYVWPKLFSALYQAIAFYYLLQMMVSKDSIKEYYILFGLASILAFLVHGGAIFYLLSLSILLLFTIKNKENIINMFYGLGVAIIMYLPWIYYQKFIDPPGDRLLKWHLAGQVPLTDKSFLTVFIEYYKNLTFTSWIDSKIVQVNHIFKSIYFDIYHMFDIPLQTIEAEMFRSTEYSFLFFSSMFIFLYALSKKNFKHAKKFIDLLLLSYILYIVLWVLILISGTEIVHGAYFGRISGFIVIGLIVYYFNRYLFILLSILNIIVFYTVYIMPYLFHGDKIASTIFISVVISFIVILRQLVIYEAIKENK